MDTISGKKEGTMHCTDNIRLRTRLWLDRANIFGVLNLFPAGELETSTGISLRFA